MGGGNEWTSKNCGEAQKPSLQAKGWVMRLRILLKKLFCMRTKKEPMYYVLIGDLLTIRALTELINEYLVVLKANCPDLEQQVSTLPSTARMMIRQHSMTLSQIKKMNVEIWTKSNSTMSLLEKSLAWLPVPKQEN